ncbi:MAG: glycosyltransferase family 2 protein [Candidatus Pacebacteria bacterium]|nr:glycosyltransferase family 2 protein [Candidatus Paceibacterota bacterium]
MTSPQLSIVVPLFNEEEAFPLLLNKLQEVCGGLGKTYEFVFVDDGSTDKTYSLIQDASKNNANIKAIRFSRNFGHQAAFNAGMDFSSGEMVVTMDGDLQHPPALIPEFIKAIEQGFDIVIGERTQNKQNSVLRAFVGKLFYKFLSAITNLEFKNASDFAIYNRRVISVLKRLPEKERFLRGLVQWVGFKKKYIQYVAEERVAGAPKYTIRRLVRLIMSGVTSFSAFPLRLAFWTGTFIFIFSIIFAGYVAVDHYTNPNPLLAGWATVVILILLLGSIQLLVLGVVGEYLYKMFNEIKGRPLYIVSDSLNMDNDSSSLSSYGLNGLR